MHTIGKRIQIAFIGAVASVSIVTLIILILNQLNVRQNQQIIQTMTMEYSVYSLSEELTSTFNDVGKNIGNVQYAAKYTSTRTKLLETVATLKRSIKTPESMKLMEGVENTAKKVIEECDVGLAEIQNNNIQNFSAHFAQAHKYNAFMLENVRTLLQKELEYLSRTQAISNRNNAITAAFSLIVFIGGIMGVLVYSRQFTKQLVDPIAELSEYAKDVASGNLVSERKKNITITQDEIGSLTKSIYGMVDRLSLMISQEKKANEEIQKNSETLKQKNEELQQMNSVMVGRELKMIAMKNEIEQLKSKNQGS